MTSARLLGLGLLLLCSSCSFKPIDEEKLQLEEVRRFTGHAAVVYAVAFSPDGRYALSGSGSFLFKEDNTLRLWEVATGKEIRRFTGHTSGVESVAFSPDGRYALSGSSDKTLRLWALPEEVWLKK